MNKYEITFTIPMSCSCIVEADNEEEAYQKINNKFVKDIKKYEFQVLDDKPDDFDKCDNLYVDRYYE